MLKFTINCNPVGRFKQLTTAKLGVGETMNYKKLGRREICKSTSEFISVIPATRVFGKISQGMKYYGGDSVSFSISDSLNVKTSI